RAADAATSDGRRVGFGDPTSFGSSDPHSATDGIVVCAGRARLDAYLPLDACRRDAHCGAAAEGRKVPESIVLYRSRGHLFCDLDAGGSAPELAFAQAGSRSVAPPAKAHADGKRTRAGTAGTDRDVCGHRLGDVVGSSLVLDHLWFDLRRLVDLERAGVYYVDDDLAVSTRADERRRAALAFSRS